MQSSRSAGSECDAARPGPVSGASDRLWSSAGAASGHGQLLAELDALEAEVRAADLRIHRLRRHLSRLLPT